MFWHQEGDWSQASQRQKKLKIKKNLSWRLKKFWSSKYALEVVKPGSIDKPHLPLSSTIDYYWLTTKHLGMGPGK